MKKTIAVVTAALALASVSVMAQDDTTTQILAQANINIKGTLSDKTKITNSSLLTNGTLAYVEYVSIFGSSTNIVLGSLSPTNIVTLAGTNAGQNVTIALFAAEQPVIVKNKSTIVFVAENFGTTEGTSSNAVFIATGTQKAVKGSSSSNADVSVSGSFSGIWQEGITTVKGSFSTVK